MSTRLTDHERQLRAVTEASWQRTVEGILRANGWTFFHAPRAGIRANGSVRAVTSGFPDLCAFRGPRLLFAELKREQGKTTDAQDHWLTGLARASAEVYEWRPSDLPDVIETLRRTP